MSDFIGNLLIMILVLVVLAGLALVPYTFGWSDGYRKGQIDALNGKIHYQLEKQDDSEFKWIECPSVCTYEKDKK